MQIRPLTAPFIGLLLGIALCTAVYYPGLHGDFIFDDWPNIVLNSRLHVDEPTVESLRAAAVSMDSGTLKRPVSMLSFWANYYSTGLDPFFFKLTNLIIHLLNGVGLFFLARLLLRSLDSKDAAAPTAKTRDGIALAAAMIWLVHPLNVTSVLYVVQRMTSLSATFTILALISYVAGRQRLVRGTSGFPLIFTGVLGFGALAVLSKENGVLLPFYVAVIELTLFRFEGVARSARRNLRALVFLGVGLPVLVVSIFLALHPEWLVQQYQHLNFTLTERLLTEARALWLYVTWMAAPIRSSLGLYHDDIPTSHGLFDPATTALALVGIVAVSVAAFRLRKRAPLLTFAVFWYLAGHLLESSFVGLELIHEHRNYLPIFGPLLACVYGLSRLSSDFAPKARFALPIIFVIALSTVTFSRSLDWSDLRSLEMASVRDHPGSARSNYEAGTALGNLAVINPELAPKIYDDAKMYLERSAALDESAVRPLFGLILLDATAKRSADEASLERLAARLGAMPLNLTVVEPFRSLVSWTTTHAVVLPEAVVKKLFESALGNSTADAHTRGMLLSIMSSYYHNVLGDDQNAVSLALAAVAEDPLEPVHHVSLAKFATVLGNLEVASRELEAAERYDTLGRFTVEIADLARSLDEAKHEAHSDGRELALR